MTIEKGLNGLDNNLLKVLGGFESATNLTLTLHTKSGECSTRQFYQLILYIIQSDKLRKMRWVKHKVRFGRLDVLTKFWSGKRKGRRQLRE